MKNVFQEYFLKSLESFSDKDALEIQEQKFSYHQFYELVSVIINAIQKEGFQHKAIVVLNDHTVYSYASIIAINFSGNTIFPVELSWPAQRISNVVSEAKPAAVLVSDWNDQIQKNLGLIHELDNCCFIESSSGKLVRNSSLNIDRPDYENIAYILFTSGSTGLPKGSPVKTESLNAFIQFYKGYNFNSGDRFLQVYDITFDVAYFSFLVPLCFGACCCIVTHHTNTPKYLSILNDLLKHNITVVSMVPTVLNFIRKYIQNKNLTSLRYSFFSGDALYHSEAMLWQQFAPDSEIHNYYGLTETTIVCTKYVWSKDASAVEAYKDLVPIGKPFPGINFKICNSHNEEVKESEIGELTFNGVQVIDHYLNNRNQEKFFYVPDEKGNLCKYYKTGDLVSLNEKGNLIFHGRIDHQVKINGYRIELEEIQATIQKITRKKSIVVKKKNNNGIHFLSAFIEGNSFNVEVLKKELEEYLPNYMIPSEFSFLDHLPLTENGKIDILYLQALKSE